MKKNTFGILLIIFIVSAVDCQKWNANGRSGSGRKAGTYYSEETNGGKSAEAMNAVPRSIAYFSQSVKQSQSKGSSGGIGAWGYVSIILFVILSGLGVYYTFIFYPIVCKKQRMYHVMGSTTV